MEVKVDVFVSLQAEAAKETGCLCVRQDGDKSAVCKHLKRNIEYEKGVSDKYTGLSDQNKRRVVGPVLTNRAISEMTLLSQGEGQISEKDGVCRTALINYANRTATNTAIAIKTCPRYESE